MLLLCVIFLTGCRNDGQKTALEGEWEDVSWVTGVYHYSFNFKGSTFFTKKFIRSDAPISACNKSLLQYDYYAGSFIVTTDSIILNGTIVKSTYIDSARNEQLVPDCNNTYGKEYYHAYKYKFTGDTLSLFPRDEYYLGNNKLEGSDSSTVMYREKLTIYLKRK